MTLSPILPSHDATTVALNFGVFIAEQARTHRVSQSAIIAALRPHITPSQPEVPSHAPAADTPAVSPASETTDGGEASSSLPSSPSVAPSPEPQPNPSAVQADAAPLRIEASPAESDAAEISAPIPQAEEAKARGKGIRAKFLEAYPLYPKWSARQFAAHLGCTIPYIRNVAAEEGLKLTSHIEAKRIIAAEQAEERAKAKAAAPKLNIKQSVAELYAENPAITTDEAFQRLPSAKRDTVRSALASLRMRDKLAAAVAETTPEPTPQAPVSPPPLNRGTLTDRVRIMHQQHPTWTARMIANELGARLSSVETLLSVVRGATKGQAEQAPLSSRLDQIKHYREVAKRLGRV